MISIDGNTLYLGDGTAYSTTSLQQTCWVPTFGTFAISSIDPTGLLFGADGSGAGFLDATQMKTTQATTVQDGTVVSPNTGPTTGGTAVSGFASATITDSATLSQIYVGNAAGQQATLGSTAQVTTPASAQTGAVDLTEILSDGGIGIQPEAFSYGPTILSVPGNASTAEGEGGSIEGYGFGQSPQVTIGGIPATNISVAAGNATAGFPPIPDTLSFKAPAGTAGTAADVIVTTAEGSATAKGAFHYVGASQYFAVPGGMLPAGNSIETGIYDAKRDLYYFTGTLQLGAFAPRILVFSLTQGAVADADQSAQCWRWLSDCRVAGRHQDGGFQ